MFMIILALVLGLGLLVWSADRFIEGSALVATHYGMSPLLAGVLFVGFGTSAPEMVVSLMAALEGNSGLALGNALGSNIINTGFVIGVTALLAPILVLSRVIRQEIPLLLGVTTLASVFLFEGSLKRWEGMVLLLGFVAVLAWMAFQGFKGRSDALGAEMEQELKARQAPLYRAWLMTLIGLVVLLLSSRLLVWGAVEVAHWAGVSDLVIGLTLVAFGTSTPELAASITAVLKGEDDIALGNILGSNIFNLLAVVGIAAVVSPMDQIDGALMARDLPATLGFTLALALFGFGFRGQGQISRLKGLLLLLGFGAYLLILFQTL